MHPEIDFWKTFFFNYLMLKKKEEFHGSSVSKEFASSAGDLGLIPASGRSPREGSGSLLHVLAWKIPWIEEPSGTTRSPWGHKN